MTAFPTPGLNDVWGQQLLDAIAERLPKGGAGMYRAATTTTTAASGTRDLTNVFDTVLYEDDGFTVNLSAGTITVPGPGWYSLDLHVEPPAATNNHAIAQILGNGAAAVRGMQVASGAAVLPAQGLFYASSDDFVFKAAVWSSASFGFIGSANGTASYFRVVSLGGPPA